jgi:hypothetical protein
MLREPSSRIHADEPNAECKLRNAEYKIRKDEERGVCHSEIRNPNSEIKKMDTHSKYLRLHRQDIAYFKFIIESYEGMAVVRTKDPHEAIVELMVAPGWESDMEEVLDGLRKEIPIESLLPETD